MNERIKELYNQSGGLVRMYDGKLTYFPAYQKNVGNGNFEFSSFDPEKFAELIVEECIKAVKPDTEYPMESVDVVEEFHRGYWVGCNDSTIRIKEHFGVEE